MNSPRLVHWDTGSGSYPAELVQRRLKGTIDFDLF